MAGPARSERYRTEYGKPNLSASRKGHLHRPSQRHRKGYIMTWLNALPDWIIDLLPARVIDALIAANLRHLDRETEIIARIMRGQPVPDTRQNRRYKQSVAEASHRVSTGESEAAVLLSLLPPERPAHQRWLGAWQ